MDLYVETQADSPCLIEIPHIGLHVPDDDPWIQSFRLKFDKDPFAENVLMESSDHLIDPCPYFSLQCNTLVATHSRLLVDLNRGVHDVDWNNRGPHPQGVIWGHLLDGRSVFHGPIPKELHAHRIKHYHAPYHMRLQSRLNTLKVKWGRTLLVSVHSMPNVRTKGIYNTDVVLGTRHGQSISKDIVELFIKTFQLSGYRVALDHPYAGAYTTQHYGRPEMAESAIQIELNRSIYFKKNTVDPFEMKRFATAIERAIHAVSRNSSILL